MSTWGGIGEGLTAGMNARIALEEQRRREALAQKNEDRQFAFQQEQANRAQANADRQFEAGRTDAANAQANADRAFDEGVRRADMAQANADREYGLKSDIAVAENDRANAELALKQEAQDWANKTNEERLRGFRLANEKLDREERQAQMIDDAKRESGRQQLAMAIYRVTGGGGQEQTIKINENGQMVDKKVRVLPQAVKEQIFGKDGYFRDVQNVVAFEDESGKMIAALVKPDGTMQMFSPEDQYSVYESGFGKGFADETMQSMADKRDLGMFAAKEEAKATAQMRVQKQAQDAMLDRKQMDVFSRQRSYEYRLAAAGEIDQAELDKRLDVIDAREQRMLEKSGGSGAPAPTNKPIQTDRTALEAERAKLMKIAVNTKGGAKFVGAEKKTDSNPTDSASGSVTERNPLDVKSNEDSKKAEVPPKEEKVVSEKNPVIPKVSKASNENSAAKLYGADVIERYRRTANGRTSSDADIIAGKHDRDLRKIGVALHGESYNPSAKSYEKKMYEEKMKRIESERKKMIDSYDEKDRMAIKTAKSAYDAAWQEADDYAVLNHGQGAIFKDDYKTTRAKKFAELVESINKDKRWNVYGNDHSSSPFGSLDFYDLIKNTYGEDAAEFFPHGINTIFSQKKRRIGEFRKNK